MHSCAVCVCIQMCHVSACVYACVCVYVYIFASCYTFHPEYLCLLSLIYLSVFLKHMVKDSLTGPNILNMLKADFALSSSLSLAKLLDYIPKTSTQGLFLYLTTMSFLRLNTKLQQSKFIIFLHKLKLSNQDILIQ